jgi:hypothetical protein
MSLSYNINENTSLRIPGSPQGMLQTTPATRTMPSFRMQQKERAMIVPNAFHRVIVVKSDLYPTVVVSVFTYDLHGIIPFPAFPLLPKCIREPGIPSYASPDPPQPNAPYPLSYARNTGNGIDHNPPPWTA